MSEGRRAGVWGLAAGLLLLVLLVLATGPGLQLQTNILRLLPADQSDPAADMAFEVFSERSMRQLLFLVEGEDATQARAAADELRAALASSGHLQSITLQITNPQQLASARFAYDYRHQLLSRGDAQLLQAGDFNAFADDAIAQIFSPFSGALVDLLPTDPFLLSYRFALASSSAEFPALRLDEGYLLAEREGRSFVLLTAALGASAFDQQVQQDITGRIEAIEAAWHGADRDLRLHRTGALFYADFAFSTAKQEVSVIGGSSLLLIVALITLVFFSLRPILMVMLALGFGIATGFTLVRLVFSEVHVLTLVFGASLIGVAVDYAFHYFVVDDASDGSQRLRRILPALSLGLLSSLIGYAALATTPFPGLQQMALFCMSGLAAAWLTVVLLFPVLPLRSRSSPRMLLLCQRFLNAGARPAAQWLFYLALLLPLAAVYLLFVITVPEADDVREFQPQDDALLAQEQLIMDILNAPAANQFYLVSGEDEQSLLRNLERAELFLDQRRAENAITGYLSLSAWLPSRERQRENHALYRRLYDSQALQRFQETGLLEESQLSEVRSAFAADEQTFISPQDWLNSPLAAQYGHLWLGEIGGRHAAVIPLRGISESGSLQDVDSSIVYVDKLATINSMINTYRSRVAMLLAVAALLIFAVLALRFGLRRAVLVIATPLTAISAAVVGLLLLGEAVNLFSTLALFLVLGISVDFGIFFAEARIMPEHTLLAVMLSALTTLFTFGLLALSQTPVIHSFGLTMLLGIGTALLLAPVLSQRLRAATTKTEIANAA